MLFFWFFLVNIYIRAKNVFELYRHKGIRVCKRKKRKAAESGEKYECVKKENDRRVDGGGWGEEGSSAAAAEKLGDVIYGSPYS